MLRASAFSKFNGNAHHSTSKAPSTSAEIQKIKSDEVLREISKKPVAPPRISTIARASTSKKNYTEGKSRLIESLSKIPPIAESLERSTSLDLSF